VRRVQSAVWRPARTKITNPTTPSTIFHVLSVPIVGTAIVMARTTATHDPAASMRTGRRACTGAASVMMILDRFPVRDGAVAVLFAKMLSAVLQRALSCAL